MLEELQQPRSKARSSEVRLRQEDRSPMFPDALDWAEARLSMYCCELDCPGSHWVAQAGSKEGVGTDR